MSNRRKFLSNATRFAAGGLLLSSLDNKVFATRRNTFSPADQINVGAIGINGMGWADLRSAMKIPGVNLVALCDVDKNVLDKRMGELTKANVDTSKIKTYGDYRKLLENKDVDVVIIGTPDHWHCLIMVEACMAGKDVYVEKPVGNSIVECRTMLDAQKKYNRAVQVGQWQRSQQHFRDAIDFVHSGQLGNIRTAKVWCYQGWMHPDPVVPDTAPPAGVDYKMWLGPAPTKAFNSSRFHFNFRWFWDYAGGLMTDWGVHLLDYALFGMKADVPKTVVALGGKFAYPELAQETPDTLTTLYEFEKFNMVWDHAMGIDNGQYGRDHGIAFVGNNATLVLDRGGWEVLAETETPSGSPKHYRMAGEPRRGTGGTDSHLAHVKNFLECMDSRARPRSDVEIGHNSMIACHLGNIAYRLNRRVAWDVAGEKMIGDAEAQALVTRSYRAPWALKS